ncbi:PP2C family protein-serine/threonine phosphatase [Aestuariimicrobium ganziense]|uniref:PP2C family protein-serine/threonine phosphatase n=1 Tax=Aestuariimicrobium ganziense TaxID=2773677 RepID=UPI00194125AA|nr:PP2C family protein-serine/threonine phosphatase [Aestuariimicrobium ganziense]
MTDEADEPTRRILRQLEDPSRTRRTEEFGAWVAGATDIGRRHHTNQDAFAIGVPDPEARRAVLVVSDGVSSSVGAERASATASSTLRDFLVDNLDLDTAELSEQLTTGYKLANDAVLADGEDGSSVGSCTLVAAVVRDHEVHLANIGDTRAYWVPDRGEAVQLSVDDSMAQAQMEMGLSREEAESSYHAHAITKWLGPEAPTVAPRVGSATLEEAGWVLICSDGLWTYASSAEAMGRLVGQFQRSMPPSDGPGVLAAALVAWANHQGGRDNITVAMARVDPPAPDVASLLDD